MILKCSIATPISSREDALVAHGGSSAGGYLQYVLHYAARHLFGLADFHITARALRNADLTEYALCHGSRVYMTAAAAYGFRNIQNVVRRLKAKKKAIAYSFVEVMACPNACINGGGQLKAETPDETRELMLRANQLYDAANADPSDPATDPDVQALYRYGGINIMLYHYFYYHLQYPFTHSLGRDVFVGEKRQWLHTSYSAIERSDDNINVSNW